MERFKINDLWVYFPFVPYAPQEMFMKKMLDTMNNAQNALLESPTGTGKTLCLVCASLAWLDNQRKLNEMPEPCEDDEDDDTGPNMPKKCEEVRGLDKTLAAGDNPAASTDSERGSRKSKIYFCTRTHSQLIQAVNEFKNTSYGHLRSTTLGSRKHLCLNPCATNAKNLDDKCAALRKKKRDGACNRPGPDIEDLPKKCTSCLNDHRCQYYVNYEDMISSGEDHVFTQAPAMDQRTLIEKSRQHKVCPFYMSRHLQKKADIIFLPYSYIFNPNILKGLQLNVMDSIIIIDEGHNLEKVCEENASFEMKISDINNCRLEVVKCLSREFLDDKDFPHDVTVTSIQELENILLKFEELASTRILPGPQIPHYDGNFCLKIFEDSGITLAEHPRLLYNLQQLSKFLGAKEQKNESSKKIHGVIDTAYCLDREDFKEFVLFKEVLTNEKVKENKEYEPKIFFWCFNAGIIMKSLKQKGVRSFIVTSGTLAPLEPLKQSLTIPFDVDLLNKHVVDRSQVLSLCITEAPTCLGDKKELLDVSYSNREEKGYLLYDALGNVIREVVKNTPKGVLLFFPSARVKNTCLTKWSDIFNKNNISLYHEINSLKQIFEEPKEASELHDLQEKYTKKIKNSSGACLIGVTSGKVSEGIDFKDDLGRAVIMIGLPFPPLFDPWVKYKRNHLRSRKGTAVEQEWYLSQAIRPVNQALGRIIRHQKDYGCVLLPDDRYNTPRVRRVLPQWLEQGLQTVSFSEIGPILQKFFSGINLRINEIEKKTENQQAQIRKRHLEESMKEEYSSEVYFKLRIKRDFQRQREEIIKKEMNVLIKAETAVKNELETLRKEFAEKTYALSCLEREYNSVMEENAKLKEENDSHEEPEKKNGDGVTGEGSITKEDYDSDFE